MGMKTLVLCVDRDDDLGVKARITSPVIGKKNNLRGLIALCLEDPEDSDANVMLMGLKLYKRYTEMGREVELATICGDKNVGHQSDANLVRQFYAVLEQFSPDTVVLVSDGAEDEVILPLISQRVQVEHISRVVIKQQQNLESTFYIIVNAFKSPKIAKKIILPLASLFVLWGILVILNLTALAFGLVIIILSLLVISKSLGIEDQIARVVEDMRAAFQTRRYFLFLGALLSIGLLIGGVITSYLASKDQSSTEIFLYDFARSLYSFVLGAALAYILGNSLDTFMRTGKFSRSSLTLLLSLGAIWFILRTTMEFLGTLVDDSVSLNVQESIGFLSLGIVLLIASGMSYTYQRYKVKGRNRAGWLR